jgi:diaminopimelate decarboxylase
LPVKPATSPTQPNSTGSAAVVPHDLTPARSDELLIKSADPRRRPFRSAAALIMDHFELSTMAFSTPRTCRCRDRRSRGTPAYIYSTATIERHARVFREALEGLDDPLIAFAVKANPNKAVLATLAKAGLGADVVSGGELLRARAAGIRPEKIVFSGVGKTADEMAQALREGIGQFNLESEPEAETLSTVATRWGLTRRSRSASIPMSMPARMPRFRPAAEDKFGVPI